MSSVPCSGDHAHDVGFLHDQELVAVELDLRARPLAEQHLVARLHVDRDQLAALVAAPWADGDDLALHRLLLGGIRNDDAAGGLFLGFNALYDHAVVQGTKLELGHDFLFAGLRSAVGWKIGVRRGWQSRYESAKRPRGDIACPGGCQAGRTRFAEWPLFW